MAHKLRQINLRITEPLRRKLETKARERGISVNNLMRQLLEDGLKSGTLEDRVRKLEIIVNGAANHPN